MSNQTKIGLLLGLGVVLLVGIIISDHLATQSQSNITDSAPVLAELSGMNPTNQPDKNRSEFLLPAPISHDEVVQGNTAINRNGVPVVRFETSPNNSALHTAMAVDQTAQVAMIPTTPVVAPVAPKIVVVTPTSAPTAAAIVTPAPAAPAQRTYTVKAGDTLSIIAANTLGSRNRWQEILNANKQTLASAKNLSIGMVLNVPTAAASVATPAPTTPPVVARTYAVQKGDLLGSIASKQLGSSKRVKDLVAANKKILTNGEKSMLHIGMVLNLPAQ